MKLDKLINRLQQVRNKCGNVKVMDKRQTNEETLYYARFYCGECDEEYIFDEDALTCVICNGELDNIE